jgi:hypothetical protein
LLEHEVGAQAGLRRLDRFMTEPQPEHGAIDTCLRQLLEIPPSALGFSVTGR